MAVHCNGSPSKRAFTAGYADYLEQQRRAEQNAGRSANDDVPVRWQAITETTQQLRILNQHNGWLLEGQIVRGLQALEVLKPHQNPVFMARMGKRPGTLRGSKDPPLSTSCHSIISL